MFEAPDGTILLTFDDLMHGEPLYWSDGGTGVVNGFDGGRYASLVTIGVENLSRSFDLAVGFDTQFEPTLPPPDDDFDLVGPPVQDWSSGNLDSTTEFGTILILPENDVDATADEILDDPDDEDGRPAGSFLFNFAEPLKSFGFDLIDVESVSAEDGFVTFDGDQSTVMLTWQDLVDRNQLLLDPLMFGDASANRIARITAEKLGPGSFSHVEVRLGGSGGIDNVQFKPAGGVIPEPSTFSLAITALITCLLPLHRTMLLHRRMSAG